MPAKRSGKKAAGNSAKGKSAKNAPAKAPTSARKASPKTTRKPPTQRASTGGTAETAAQSTSAGKSEWQLDAATVESALLTGESSELLQDYFGPENYREMKQLARDAAARGVRGGPRVLVLPGIMGSQIGVKTTSNVYWFDPWDIALGRITKLAVSGSKDPHDQLGVMLLYYLKLKLRLRAAGYDADFYPFDWRKSIADLGQKLAERMNVEGKDVSLVAHSMGGLVARWAMGEGKAKCSKLIMLGTPNFGSWAPVMAFRAAYPLVRKVGAVDLHHTAEELAQNVFNTFPGLTEMFPEKDKQGPYDVHNLANWPSDKLVPRRELLAKIDAVRAGMLEKGDNVYMIAGVDQETPVGVEPTYGNGEAKPPTAFAYKYSHDGDGTVPLDYAVLPGAKRTYYIAEQHGSLPNNKVVAKAVLDLLDRGETNVLSTTRPVGGGARAVRTVSEAELRSYQPYEGRRGRGLSANELRHVLDEFVSPDARDTVAPVDTNAPLILLGGASAPPEGYNHRFDSVVVGRRRQHRIDLRFARGSITQVDARALAVGIFRDVAPGGAAAAIDRRLSGAITDLTKRRMFSGNVGEVFVLPTGRHALAAEIIAFVGLGDFDRYQDEVLQTAAENLIRTFVRSRIEEFGTVVFGGALGDAAASGLRNMLGGFVRGLLDADTDHQFRRIIIAENNQTRYDQLKQELFRLSSTSLCQDIELTFDEIVLPDEPEVTARTGTRAAKGLAPIYLTVRQEPDGTKKTPNIRTSLLTTGDKATVVTGIKELKLAELDALRDKAVAEGTKSFDGIGNEIAKLLLTEDIQAVLPRFKKHHLVIVHDAATSRAPWETIAFKVEGSEKKYWYPGQEAGISHRFAAEKLSVAKWLDERVLDGVLNVLLVVDPTGDLPGAREEGQRVGEMLGRMSNCKVDRLLQKEATRPALLAALGSGKYDVVHYAGHAAYSETDSAQSGLLCHNHAMVTGVDLAAVSRLPTLVFFNACETARVRKLGGGRVSLQAKNSATRERAGQIQKTVSVAEALMRGGIANFLGTYWPVNDEAAAIFASEFYPALLQGETIGDAIQKARKVLVKKSNKDWANYLFYGNQDFILKEGGGNG